MVVCAVLNLVQFRYNVCPCLLDTGCQDIQVLPNGLAFITSVSSGGRLCYLLIKMMLLLISMTTTITDFSVYTIVDNVDNDDVDTRGNVEDVIERRKERMLSLT